MTESKQLEEAKATLAKFENVIQGHWSSKDMQESMEYCVVPMCSLKEVVNLIAAAHLVERERCAEFANHEKRVLAKLCEEEKHSIYEGCCPWRAGADLAGDIEDKILNQPPL